MQYPNVLLGLLSILGPHLKTFSPISPSYPVASVWKDSRGQGPERVTNLVDKVYERTLPSHSHTPQMRRDRPDKRNSDEIGTKDPFHNVNQSIIIIFLIKEVKKFVAQFLNQQKFESFKCVRIHCIF